MVRNYLIFLSFVFTALNLNAQQLTLKKGIIIDSVVVDEDSQETFSLFLPTSFKNEGKWPILTILDLMGENKKALSMFTSVAEKEGFILASPNNLSDSVTLSKNMQFLGNMFSEISRILPVNKNRIYTAGFSAGAQFASLVPLFIKEVDGVISIGGSLPNAELLSTKNRFHYVGIVAREDFSFRDLVQSKKILNQLKFENQLILFDAENKLPEQPHLLQALRWLKLSDMAKGILSKDSVLIKESFTKDINTIDALVKENKLLLAEQLMGEVESVYRLHANIDSLKNAKKELRKQKEYRAQRRAQNTIFFKENLVREDYQYYLEEDVLTHNFNNLGWWNFQMGELNKYIESKNSFEKQMGARLKSYVNALVEDDIISIESEKNIDEDALTFLWMLKTITDSKNPEYYLKVISKSAKDEDFGTALFYLEELLKTGFKDKQKLYSLEHTALFKITPEFNKTVSKYLSDARYDVIEE